MDSRENSVRGYRLRALVFWWSEPGWPRERHSFPDLLLEEAILAALEPQQLIHPVELLDERLLLHGHHLRGRPSKRVNQPHQLRERLQNFRVGHCGIGHNLRPNLHFANPVCNEVSK